MSDTTAKNAIVQSNLSLAQACRIFTITFLIKGGDLNFARETD